MRRYLVPGILLYLICSLAWADGLSVPIAAPSIGRQNIGVQYPPQSGTALSIFDIGSAFNDGGSDAVINPITSAVSSGKLIVVFVYDANLAVTSPAVNDSGGNTYTLDESIINQADTGFSLLVFHSYTTTALTTSSTITYTNASAITATIQILGVAVGGYSSADTATSNSSWNVNTENWSVSGAGSAAVPNEINFGLVYSPTGGTFSLPSGWNDNPPTWFGNVYFFCAWQINTGNKPPFFCRLVGV